MNQTLTLPIDAKYWDFLYSGQKTIEGRINKPPYSELECGDEFIFKDKENRKLIVKITKIKKFINFPEMLSHYNYKNFIPDVASLEAATEIYRTFPGYREAEKALGVLAIHLEIQGCIHDSNH